jgi:hypothetical protein
MMWQMWQAWLQQYHQDKLLTYFYVTISISCALTPRPFRPRLFGSITPNFLEYVTIPRMV